MMARAGLVAVALLATGIAGTRNSWAQDRIHLHTNEAEIGEVLRDGGLAIDDPLAVFGAVLKNLPERAQVYPTENYFYFRFTHKAAVYAGNIRLAAADRDRGKVNFAYNEQPTDWNPNPKYRHAVLGAEQGVIVEQAAPLAYRIAHGGQDRLLRPQRSVQGPAAARSAPGRREISRADLRQIRHSLLSRLQFPAEGLSLHSRRDRAGRRPVRGPRGRRTIQIGKRTGLPSINSTAGKS